MFSLAEASFIASSKSKVYKMKQEGNKKAKLLDKILEQRETMISTLLFGNNAVNILASSIVTIIALEYLPFKLYESSPLIGSLGLTIIILIFSEIVPKTIAINNPERVAVSLAGLCVLVKKVMWPPVYLLNKVAYGIIRIVSANKNQYAETALDTIRGEIEYHHVQGALKHDKDMLEGVLNLVEMDVETVMTHRKDCKMIDIQSSILEITDFLKETSHTRIPVYDDTPDKIIGIIHLKDYLILTQNKKEVTHEDIKSILLFPLFVPLNIKLKTQLMEFKKKRSHLAIVVDEYGGMMGIVTLADILEEIVGTIEDEHDDGQKNIIEESSGVYIVNGECQISDFNRQRGSHFNYEGASTMAGLVIEKAEKIPDEGEEFIISNYKFTILQKEVSKISLLKIEVLQNPIQNDEDD